MHNYRLHQQINTVLQQQQFDVAGEENHFFMRFIANPAAIDALFKEICRLHPQYEKISADGCTPGPKLE